MEPSKFKHKVSVVTVVRNGRSDIVLTMDSVGSQEYRDFEYCVVDGLSTDGTYGLVLSHKAVTHASSEADTGIYDAMNKGILRSKGEWIGLINAGDFYFPWTLQAIRDAVRQNPDADIIHGNQLQFEEYKRFCFYRVQEPNIGKGVLRDGPSIFHPTCFVRRELYDRIGMFDTSYRIDADYEFLLRAERAGARFHYVPKLLAGYRSGGASSSCVRFSEGYKILRKYSIHRYTDNTLRLIRCLVMKGLSHVVDFEARMEKKRLEVS